jgi:4-amino-4-deoxy-L-arabinose transferase-like glycosyltransferase
MSGRAHLAGLAVFLLALALRVAYVHEDAAVIGLDVSRLSQTDNYVFAQWARLIADGDVLCREQPHAYHLWTREVAPESKWLEWYGGQQIYHQAPFYPYLVAAVYTLFDRRPETIGYVQAVLGALTCWLTWHLARRLVSPLAGLAAGLLLACMGSFYFYDAFILRDSLMALLTIVLAVALSGAVERDRPSAWIGAGAALGLFTLAKETGQPLLLLTLLLLAWFWREQPRRLARAAALLLVGWGLVTAPALWRNHEVGAPLMKLSTRGPEVVVAGNAAGQDGVGWHPPTETMRQILMDSNFQIGRTALLTVATHRADPWGFVALLWNKTAACFNAWEVPNNVDFYLSRAHLTSLRLGFVSMWFVAPAALLGLLLGWPRRRELAVPYLLLIALTASIVVLYILGRFRVQIVPLLALFAGLAIDWAWRKWRARRLMALGVAALPFGLFVAWCAPAHADPFNDLNRDGALMLQLVKAGNFGRALYFRDRLVEAVRNNPSMVANANLEERLGALTRAFAHFDESLVWPEESAERHLHVGLGYAALLKVAERFERTEFSSLAMDEFGQALALDPQVAGAWHGMGLVHGENQRLGPALSAFTQELQLHPDHAEAHRDAGLIFMSWKRGLDALQHFRLADALGLEDGPMLAAMAHLEVDTSFKEAPPLRVLAHMEPAWDNPRGLVDARRALALAPDDPAVLEHAAYALYANDQWDEAVALLRRLGGMHTWRAAELERAAAGFLQIKAMKQPAGQSAPAGPDEAGAAGDSASGSAPAESAPAGSAPAGSAPAGSAPAGSAPAESVPAKSVPAGSAPVESAPAGSATPAAPGDKP